MAIARSVRTAKNVAAAKVLKKLKETDRVSLLFIYLFYISILD